MKRITKIEENNVLSVKTKTRVLPIAEYLRQVMNSLSALIRRKHIMRIISNPIASGSTQGYFTMKVSQARKRSAVTV